MKSIPLIFIRLVTSVAQRFWRKWQGWWNRPIPFRRRRLVKNRPATLEQRYDLLQDRRQADDVFQRLRENIFSGIDRDRTGRPLFREFGRIAPDRAYFFIQAAGENGLLFERSGMGWVLSRAHKVVEKDLFMRDGEPLDKVSLFQAADRPVYPRISSPLLGQDLLSFSVYERRLLKALRL